MKKEVTIEAVKVEHNLCGDCIFNLKNGGGCGIDPESFYRLGVKYCNEGYIYKIKDV